MPKRVVRIYEGTQENTNVIGFNAGIIGMGDDETLIDFFDARGYTAGTAPEEPEGGVSHRYLQVEPPLSEDHLQELGALCLELTAYTEDIVEVIDNRHSKTEDMRHSGEIVVSH